MCTAITYYPGNHYFGRNLDLYYHYEETVSVTPRKFPFMFRKAVAIDKHYALIGIATVADGYPLYYDAINEFGLGMAGLNFPGNALYHEEKADMDNIAPFELIPWVLAQCKTVREAVRLLHRCNPVNIPFSPDYPLTDLHWIVADKQESVTVEPMENGLVITQNPVGVLTNNPPFDYHIHNLKNYLNLTREAPENRIAPQLELTPYSAGMGAIGLPGDLSSASRFVRAAFTKLNSVAEHCPVSQFFHILGSVAQQNGCVKVGDSFEKTVYSSCCDLDRGIYYYTTYENSQITGIDMHRCALDSSILTNYPLITTQQIRMENQKTAT